MRASRPQISFYGGPEAISPSAAASCWSRKHVCRDLLSFPSQSTRCTCLLINYSSSHLSGPSLPKDGQWRGWRVTAEPVASAGVREGRAPAQLVIPPQVGRRWSWWERLLVQRSSPLRNWLWDGDSLQGHRSCFPVVAGTNDDRFRGFMAHTCITPQGWRFTASRGLTRLKSGCEEGCVPFWRLPCLLRQHIYHSGGSLSFPLPASRGFCVPRLAAHPPLLRAGRSAGLLWSRHSSLLSPVPRPLSQAL